MLDRITRWAASRSDVIGLLLVGSHARGTARIDSDIDVVLLTTDPARYTENEAWASDLRLPNLIRQQVWGAITERRFVTDSGLEIEIGIGSPNWANTAPVDPGIRRVITDGAVILLDPAGVLAGLLNACRT
jgi:predicted nucleotidyltransferase